MLSQLTPGAFSQRTGLTWQCSEFMELYTSAFPCFICFLLMTLSKGVNSSYHFLVLNVLSVGSGQDLDGSQLGELEDANSYACYNVSGPLFVGHVSLG